MVKLKDNVESIQAYDNRMQNHILSVMSNNRDTYAVNGKYSEATTVILDNMATAR